MFSSQLNPEQRQRAIHSLAKEEFDLLVIGGGVTGAGAALDAVSRGLKVALIEATDFAAGTSSRSSKLIHGGLRYLEQYDFKLVREALHERELMVSTQSPHLVKPVAFLYPIQEKVKERTYIGAGLALYDVLRGFQRELPWHRHISQKKIAEIAPSLRPDLINGAIKYFDAQVDDARHTMSIARTAALHGAVIATKVQCINVIRKGKRIIGVKVCDEESGREFDISAKTTVMCAGIWSDELHRKFGLKPGYEVATSKGVHIVLPGHAIRSDAGITLKTSLSVLFVIPWANQWIVGTTDTVYEGDLDSPLATREDVEYILSQANRILEPRLRIEDVVGVYAGLRPLVASTKDSSTTKISREHVVDRPAPGFVSVAGGKYTTYRVMAKDAIDLAVLDLRRIVPDSVTEKVPLVGADGYFAWFEQRNQIAEMVGIDEQLVTHLLNRYGSLIHEVFAIFKENPELKERLSLGLPYLKAEIYYAVSHEGAQSVDDVMSRRTRIAFEADQSGIDLASDVANIIAPLLGWSVKEKKASIARYIEKVRVENLALQSIKNKTSS
jgi:glycerol-3-phosphate dehydrogenase